MCQLVFLVGLLLRTNGVESSSTLYRVLPFLLLALCGGYLLAWAALVARAAVALWQSNNAAKAAGGSRVPFKAQPQQGPPSSVGAEVKAAPIVGEQSQRRRTVINQVRPSLTRARKGSELPGASSNGGPPQVVHVQRGPGRATLALSPLRQARVRGPNLSQPTDMSTRNPLYHTRGQAAGQAPIQ